MEDVGCAVVAAERSAMHARRLSYSCVTSVVDGVMTCGVAVASPHVIMFCHVSMQPPVSPITAAGAAVVAGPAATGSSFEGAAARAKAKDHGLYAEIVKIESELEVS